MDFCHEGEETTLQLSHSDAWYRGVSLNWDDIFNILKLQ